MSKKTESKKSKVAATEEPHVDMAKEAIAMDEFLTNPENRKLAEKRAIAFWKMIGKPTDTTNTVYRKSEIVKRTNFTNKSLFEVLELLHLFGFIVFTKGRYEFKFCFGKEQLIEEACMSIVELTEVLNFSIKRYLSLFEENELEDAREQLKKNLTELIKL